MNLEIDNDEYWPLFEKSYVDIILTKSAVKPTYSLYLPKKMNKELPSAGVHVVLTCGRKNTGWRKFVDDNNLKEGDGLVFELSECSTSKIESRVQIFRGDFPA
ncbi:hypothetical protein H5410_011600 [Solanum commersonii]|uniref:TF-B3 domain-containing protein n=1 Tax=Solanum commersonii TaxID=4109 RepID=A0A9J6AP52_SOLCO|nr:hypothetical protein H5410_011600 [Solanum commersonii]